MKSLIVLSAFLALVMSQSPFQVIFQWQTIDLTWASEEERQIAINRKDYIEENNAIAGIKFWKDNMYLTIPRWKDGIPVTLAVTSATPQIARDGRRITAPRLQPYPNWDMQKIGDCSALQFVQSMEIDPKGRMWVLDTGRTSTLTLQAKMNCQPRLVILDLENNGQVLRSYNFPEEVASASRAYLNDIVIDHQDGGLAYITDSDVQDPGIIVYSLQNNTSWKIRHDSMRAQTEAIGFLVGKTHVLNPIHIDGIALSPAGNRLDETPNNRLLFYSPLSSFHLYAVPVAVLKNRTRNIDGFVQDLGRKNSQSDGMVMSQYGNLYFSLLGDDAVAMWNISTPFATGRRFISRDHVHQQWPDSFAFDDNGNLWCVVNTLQNYLTNQVNVNQPNYRLLRSAVNSKSYLYYEDGSAPEWSTITSAASHTTLFLGINIIITSSLSMLLATVLS